MHLDIQYIETTLQGLHILLTFLMVFKYDNFAFIISLKLKGDALVIMTFISK